MYKPLPIGIDDFKKIRENNYYYIDKTLFIKEILDKSSEVKLFTRPRRFGKTLALSMLRYFFEAGYDPDGCKVDNSSLFKGLKIMDAGENYTRRLCQYPVIRLSLKSAKQPDFDMAFDAVVNEISKEFEDVYKRQDMHHVSTMELKAVWGRHSFSRNVRLMRAIGIFITSIPEERHGEKIPLFWTRADRKEISKNS